MSVTSALFTNLLVQLRAIYMELSLSVIPKTISGDDLLTFLKVHLRSGYLILALKLTTFDLDASKWTEPFLLRFFVCLGDLEKSSTYCKVFKLKATNIIS